jgi:RNA polymerase sigma-70 factor (ECF subfamily)
MIQFNQEELFNAFKAGDVKAFNDVFKLYYEPLYRRSCFAIVEDIGVAQDVARDALFKVWVNRDKVQNYEHLRALIYLNARNLSFNHKRNKKARKEIFYDVISDEWCAKMVFDPNIYNDILETINKEIAFMNEEDQRIAEYLIFQQLKPKEIAELMNKNEQTVRNKKTMILKKLKSVLIRRESFYD